MCVAKKLTQAGISFTMPLLAVVLIGKVCSEVCRGDCPSYDRVALFATCPLGSAPVKVVYCLLH